MPLFGAWTSSADQTDADQADRRTTRSQTAANLQLPPTSNAPAVGRSRPCTPSPLPVGHNANSSVSFAYDPTYLAQIVRQQQQQQPELHHSDFEDEEDGNAAAAAATQRNMSSTQSTDELRLFALLFDEGSGD